MSATYMYHILHYESAGNGALMRLAPVPLFFLSDPKGAIEYAGESSKTTHMNIQSVDSCRFYSGLICGALNGHPKKLLLSPLYCPIENYQNYFPLCPQVKKIAAGSYLKKYRTEIKSTGYVIDSMEAALWAFSQSNSFESGLIKAVNLGGDSDTIGAIYEQLAGAYYGEPNIPFRLIEPLKYFHYFYFFADELLGFYNGKDQIKKMASHESGGGALE